MPVLADQSEQRATPQLKNPILPPLQQTLQVVVLADPGYESLPNYRGQIGDRIDSASDILRTRLGLELNLKRIESWKLRQMTTPHPLLQTHSTRTIPRCRPHHCVYVLSPFKRR